LLHVTQLTEISALRHPLCAGTAGRQAQIQTDPVTGPRLFAAALENGIDRSGLRRRLFCAAMAL